MQIFIDYPVNPNSRWDINNPHPELFEIISRNKNKYSENLQDLLKFQNNFYNIQKEINLQHPERPFWNNNYFPPLDAISLYGMLCKYNPEQYLEIGSGNSTKFARMAIHDHDLKTQIISVDPHPREEINNICDEIIRSPVEEIDLSIFKNLEDGDILFIDNSHRVFTNSDVTVIFLEILPRLKKGVIVEFHDIFLPYDYPEIWKERYYSEQYMLGVYLLSNERKIDILFPNTYITYNPDLFQILLPIWNHSIFHGIFNGGASMWMRMH